MLDLSLWETRLTSQVSDLDIVSQAINLEQAMDAQKNHRVAAFVVPSNEVAGVNKYSNAVDQTISTNIAVLLGVRMVNDTGGTKTTATLTDRVNKIRASLVGWLPTDAEDLIELKSGRLARIDQSTIWWLDEFRTTYRLRNVT